MRLFAVGGAQRGILGKWLEAGKRCGGRLPAQAAIGAIWTPKREWAASWRAEPLGLPTPRGWWSKWGGSKLNCPSANSEWVVDARPSRSSRRGHAGSPRAVGSLQPVQGVVAPWWDCTRGSRWGGSQADSCHLGGTRLSTPFLPGLFNKQDDTLSRRAPEMLFACILSLTYSQEEPSQGWPVLGGFPAISVPKRGFEWKSSQIAGCS